ncbi:gustatory receptor 39 [Nasonia vitripennis]|uniref:Gustatory receptor n=1 Tax=Nasonia vitripennis TaxID=7425 RepID=A0A7M6UVR4_NASVI|nr:gustatory receptor 39 [Nasonia vitripennis]
MDILKITLNFFKMCGLATMRFDAGTTQNTSVQSSWCTSSKKGQVYNLFLICLITASNGYVATIVYEYNISTQEFDKSFDVAQYIYTSATTVAILMLYCFCQGRAVSIVNNLKIMHKLVTNVNSRLSKEEEPTMGGLKRIAIMTTVIWFVVVFTSCNLSFGVVMYYLTLYPCILIINCTFLQYTMILHLLKQLFAILNANFRYVSRQSIVPKIAVAATNSMLQISTKKTQPFSDLCELYTSLCDLSMDISKFYHLAMLFCVSHVFITLTTWLYYITKPLVTGAIELSIIDYTHSLLILMHNFFMLFILTKSVDAVVDEKTGKITNRWLANLQDQHLVNELNLFSNYLLHKNVSFTVYGLFSLNETLLMSITGSITTYLVIILQFQSGVQK